MFRKTAAYSPKKRPKRPDYRLPQGAESLEVKAHALNRQAYVYEPDENASDAMNAGRRQSKAMRGGQAHYADSAFADEAFQSFARIVRPAAADASRADNTRTKTARIEPARSDAMPASAVRPAQRPLRAIDSPSADDTPASQQIKRRGIIRRENAVRDTVDEQSQYESQQRTAVRHDAEARSTAQRPRIRATQNHAGVQSDQPGASKRTEIREKPKQNDSVITSRVQAAKARAMEIDADADYQKNVVTRVRSDGSTLITRAQSAEARMMAAAARRVAVQENGDDRFSQPQSRMQRKVDKQRSIKAKKAVTRRSVFPAKSEGRNPRQANISRRIIILGGVGLAAVIAALVFMFAQGGRPPAFQNPQLTSAIAIMGGPEETQTTGAFPADIPAAANTVTPTNTPASTLQPSVTASESLTKTPAPASTPTPKPTATLTPRPTATPTPRPTSTPTPKPTATPTPQPTATPTPQPTATPTPQPTATPTPEPPPQVTPTPQA